MVIAGAPIALWLARRKGAPSAAVEGLLTLPLVLPPVVTGYLFLLLFSPQGPLGRWLERIGIRVVLDWKGAVIASVALAFPLFLAVAKVAFSKADPSLESAARTLNASPLRVLGTVTLPPALPGLAAGAALAFARAFGEFGATMMLAGNIPGQTRTVPQAIFTELMIGQTRAAWGLVVVSVVIGIGAIVGARLCWPPGEAPARSGPAMLEFDLKAAVGAFHLEAQGRQERPRMGLFGPSGAGKTTLLHCIAGLIRPSEGTIRLDGEALFDSARGVNWPPHRRRIGYVFQEGRLFPHMSVRANIEYGRAAGGGRAQPGRTGEGAGPGAVPGPRAGDALRRRAPARGAGAVAGRRPAAAPDG